MKEWKEYNIGEICDTISDTYDGNASNVVLINTSDVLEGKCLNHTFVPNKDLRGQFKKQFKKNDILYSEIRPANKRYAFIDFEPTDYIASTKLMVIRSNDKVLPKFLYYILQSKEMIETLQFLAESRSGTFPQITFSELAIQTILLPEVKEQNKIVNFLEALDSKIELNRRINGNLEQQAQALFKAWFVDFEPFKDGKFVDSELGRIPEGWKVGRFNNIIESTLSGDWGKERQEGNYIKKVFCLRGADIPDVKTGNKGYMPIRFILEKNFATKALTAGNLVIEISGGSPTQSTGRICRISHELLTKYNNSIVCTNFCKAIRPMVGYSSFMYYMWEKLYNEGVMFSYENGTTGIKNLDINGLTQKEPIIIPPIEVALNFEKYVDIYYNKIQKNGIESELLSHLRDTLLPRLMSGELNVNTITE